MRPLALALSLFASSALSQDPEEKITALIDAREQAIEEVNQKFESQLAQIKQSAIDEIEKQFETSMKSLDLEKSNQLSELLQAWKEVAPRFYHRMIFMRDHDDKDDQPWFFVRGPEGIWIEHSPGGLFQHKQTAETPAFVELANENGYTHRLYESKNMYSEPERETFQLGAKGYWLSDIEVNIPDAE